MNYGSKILNDISQLIELFKPHCVEHTTLVRIEEMLGDADLWPEAHGLHSVIRGKTIEASDSGNSLAECQYLFEEICAKTLYNLSHESAPFDPDSPYWIVPNALSFASRVGIPESDIVTIVSG